MLINCEDKINNEELKNLNDYHLLHYLRTPILYLFDDKALITAAVTQLFFGKVSQSSFPLLLVVSPFLTWKTQKNGDFHPTHPKPYADYPFHLLVFFAPL